MKIAIMQPYIFPYLGYYQLVAAVDQFVFFDDVNFIKKGWINRNQLLQQSKPLKFTVPLKNASQNRLINEIELFEYSIWRRDFLKTIELNYKKALHFEFTFNWLKEFLFLKDYTHISDLASDSIKSISGLLSLPVNFNTSSSLEYKNIDKQKGQEKIIAICKILEASHYINPKNGTALYDREKFKAQNIRINFIETNGLDYDQFNLQQFVSGLSIIDVLMFNSKEKTRELLSKYSLN